MCKNLISVIFLGVSLISFSSYEAKCGEGKKGLCCDIQQEEVENQSFCDPISTSMILARLEAKSLSNQDIDFIVNGFKDLPSVEQQKIISKLPDTNDGEWENLRSRLYQEAFVQISPPVVQAKFWYTTLEQLEYIKERAEEDLKGMKGE